ncbi:MAG: hypothetical protein QXT32_03745 [Candidatus Nitrosocaldaceae archaeon]
MNIPNKMENICRIEFSSFRRDKNNNVTRGKHLSVAKMHIL